MQIPSRCNWIFDRDNTINNKEDLLKINIIQMLNKTTSMFKYKNLPDTIKEKDLELQLQVNGYTVFKEVDGKLYSFYAGLGGEPNPYYLPTKAIIANPALRYNESLNIDENCVLVTNDNLYFGLMPILYKYCGLLVEGELSLKYALINARVPAIVTADNDMTKESAVEFFNKIIKGEEYGIVASNEFLDGVQTKPFNTTGIIDIIEGIQYVKASMYNEIGLNAIINMKRESINEAESTMNDDVLFPSIDTMLNCRKLGIEKVNKMFNTNIEVDLNSSWKKKVERKDLEIDLLNSEIEANDSEIETNDSETDMNEEEVTDDSN